MFHTHTKPFASTEGPKKKGKGKKKHSMSNVQEKRVKEKRDKKKERRREKAEKEKLAEIAAHTASIEAAAKAKALKKQQKQKDKTYKRKIKKQIKKKQIKRQKIKRNYQKGQRSFSVLSKQTKQTIEDAREKTFYLQEHQDVKKPRIRSSSGFCAICLQKSVGCCSICRDQWYCSRKCQRTGWKGKKEEEEEVTPHKEVCRVSQDPRTVHHLMYRAREMSVNSRQLLFNPPHHLAENLRKYCNIRPGSIFSCIVASNDRYEFTEVTVLQAIDHILERCTLYINNPPPTGNKLYDEIFLEDGIVPVDVHDKLVQAYTNRLGAGGCIVYCLGNNQNEDSTEEEFMPFCIFDPISSTIYNSIRDVDVDNELDPYADMLNEDMLNKLITELSNERTEEL